MNSRQPTLTNDGKKAQSKTLDILHDDFVNSPEAAADVQQALQMYRAANISTQQQMAVDHIVSTKKLAHYANTAINALDEAEGELVQLTNENALLKGENNEYKSRFGVLDEATRQRLRQSTQLVPLNSDRQRSIQRLQKHSKLLLDKERQCGDKP